MDLYEALKTLSSVKLEVWLALFTCASLVIGFYFKAIRPWFGKMDELISMHKKSIEVQKKSLVRDIQFKVASIKQRYETGVKPVPEEINLLHGLWNDIYELGDGAKYEHALALIKEVEKLAY